MTEIENREACSSKNPTRFVAVEDALYTLQLVEAPPFLSKKVIQELENRPQLPRFHLLWIDYVLSLFVAGMLALIYLVDGALPTELKLYLRLKALYWLQRLELDPWIPIMGIGGALLVVMGLS